MILDAVCLRPRTYNWCRWGGNAWRRSSVPLAILGKGNLGESTFPKQELPPFCANSTEESKLIKVFTVICCCCFYKSLHTAMSSREAHRTALVYLPWHLWKRKLPHAPLISLHALSGKKTPHKKMLLIVTAVIDVPTAAAWSPWSRKGGHVLLSATDML